MASEKQMANYANLKAKQVKFQASNVKLFKFSS